MDKEQIYGLITFGVGSFLILISVGLIWNESKLISAVEETCNSHYIAQFEKMKALEPKFTVVWGENVPIKYVVNIT